jgi:hypothetical protein
MSIDDSTDGAPKTKFPILELEGPATVELALEQRFSILHNIFKHQYFAVYKRIGELYGWDVANRIAGEVADEATPMLAEAYQRRFELPGKGAALVSQVIQVEFQGEGSDAAVVTETADEAELDLNCTFGNALQKPRFRDIPITDGLCEAGCRVWADDIAKSVDPELNAERLTWMGDGAPRCKYRVWREKPAG